MRLGRAAQQAVYMQVLDEFADDDGGKDEMAANESDGEGGHKAHFFKRIRRGLKNFGCYTS